MRRFNREKRDLKLERMAFGILVVVIGLAHPSIADVAIWSEGDWPEDWPEELEPYREKARTIDFASLISETTYEIPFDSRDTFEKLWPVILSVKDKGAPIVLVSEPSKKESLFRVKAGVRIVCPTTAPTAAESRKAVEEFIDPEDRHWVEGFPLDEADGRPTGPPWPDYIYDENGNLPEYAAHRDGRWKASTGEERNGSFMMRVRTEIHLVVDGEIVDLNRIKLPPDTPIVDRRRIEDDAAKGEDQNIR